MGFGASLCTSAGGGVATGACAGKNEQGCPLTTDAQTHIVTITMNSPGIGSHTAVDILLYNFTSPNAEASSAVATLRTFDEHGGLVDGPGSLQMDEISHSLKGLLRWETTRDTPSVTTSARLKFTTTDPVPVGGSITLLLPNEGWSIQTSTPVVQVNVWRGSTSRCQWKEGTAEMYVGPWCGEV